MAWSMLSFYGDDPHEGGYGKRDGKMRARVSAKVMKMNLRETFLATSFLALLAGYGLSFPAVTTAEDPGTAPSGRQVEMQATPDGGANAPTQGMARRELRFDAFLLGSAVAPASPGQGLPSGLMLPLGDQATLSVYYKRMKQVDFLSGAAFDKKPQAVMLGLTGTPSEETLLEKDSDAERYNISLFWRPSGQGGSNARYLSGEQKILGLPETSTAVGVVGFYRLSSQLIFDTTFEKSDMDGNRWVGGLHLLLPNDHILSVQGRYTTNGDSELDGTPTVMVMYTIPFGVSAQK